MWRIGNQCSAVLQKEQSEATAIKQQAKFVSLFLMPGRTFGKLLFVSSISLFVYYTVWVLVVPLLDSETGSFIKMFFPSSTLAVAVPTLLCLVTFVGLVVFLSVAMISHAMQSSASHTRTKQS